MYLQRRERKSQRTPKQGYGASRPKVTELNLKTVVGREKAVQVIDVHRECTHCVVTFWVMSRFLNFLGAARDCADFRDPTAVFRLKEREEDMTYMRKREGHAWN